MRNHTKSFPRQTSHYSRQDTPLKRFLNPDLNVSRMHHLYLEAHKPEVIECEKEIITVKKERIFPLPLKIKLVVTEHRYRMVFNRDFNLGLVFPARTPVSIVKNLILSLHLICTTWVCFSSWRITRIWQARDIRPCRICP